MYNYFSDCFCHLVCPDYLSGGLLMSLKIKKCSCGKEIVFLKTKKDKWIPVNRESLSMTDFDTENLLFEYGRHIAHFTECPDSKNYRKGGE